MSWLSDRTGLHLGNIGAPVGALLGSFVGMPQVGAALGQGIGALGSGSSLGSAAAQGAGAYGGAKLLGGMMGGGGGGGGGPSLPGQIVFDGAGNIVSQGAPSGGGGGIMSTLGNLLGGGQGGSGGDSSGGQQSGVMGILQRLGLTPKDAIGIAGGALGGIQDQNNQNANRNLTQQQIDLAKQQYGDTHARQLATSAGMSPILQRLLGAWGPQGAPNQPVPSQPAPQVGGMLAHFAQMPPQGAPAPMQVPQQPMIQRQPAPVPMRPQMAPQGQPMMQPPGTDPNQSPVLARLGYGRPQMMQRAA